MTFSDFKNLYKSFVRIDYYEDEEVDINIYSNGHLLVESVHEEGSSTTICLMDVDHNRLVNCDYDDVSSIVSYIQSYMSTISSGV